MLFNLFIVLLLLLLNGLLAMSELALVSSRPARLQAMLRRQRRGAHSALALLAHPGRFLSTVQVGITVVGVFAGAFSGATLAAPLAEVLEAYGMSVIAADRLALGLVVILVTYLSLIVGELVPKQLALRHAEALACAMAPAMQQLARFAAPLVWLLDGSSRLLLRLFGTPVPQATKVTDEEIRALITEAASAGVVEQEERQMIAGVMRLADRSVRAIMTERHDVDWIDLDAPAEQAYQVLRNSRHSKLVAARGNIDNVVGLITAKRLVDSVLDGAAAIDIAGHVEEALVIPDSLGALDAMEKLRRSRQHAALVVDEFGGFQGLVTTTDVLSAIAGEFHLETSTPQPDALQRSDGSWLVNGSMPADELAELLGMQLPKERDYETVAGLVLTALGRLPGLADAAEVSGWSFEVVDLDGHRIDKLLVRRLPGDSG